MAIVSDDCHHSKSSVNFVKCWGRIDSSGHWICQSNPFKWVPNVAIYIEISKFSQFESQFQSNSMDQTAKFGLNCGKSIQVATEFDGFVGFSVESSQKWQSNPFKLVPNVAIYIEISKFSQFECQFQSNSMDQTVKFGLNCGKSIQVGFKCCEFNFKFQFERLALIQSGAKFSRFNWNDVTRWMKVLILI